METIVLGGGCFWCLEASFNLIDGITQVTSGYAGGTEKEAEYYTVSSGSTGHAEVVEVSFDTSILKLSDVLDIFWAIHNPTTLNRQGNDVGPQYRSAIFYANEQQKNIAVESIAEIQKAWEDPVVTELTELEKFYPAEEYHQNYFENHPEQAYCQIIINPKLEKVRTKFAERLKKS